MSAKQQQEKAKYQIDIQHDEFSPEAIRKALHKHSLGHWSFRYSVVAVILALVAIPLFGFSQVIFGALLLALGTVSISLIYNYILNSGNFIAKHVEQMQEVLVRKTEAKREQLIADLRDMGHRQGYNQISQVQKKFDVLTEMLKSKFDEEELTYKRYFGMAQEVFLSVIDNLNEVSALLKSVKEIDSKAITSKLETLDSSDRMDEAEIKTLEKRLDIFDEAQKNIRMLLVENEQALTLIDETTLQVSKIDVNNKEGKVDMENSMKGLAELAKRSQDYSI